MAVEFDVNRKRCSEEKRLALSYSFTGASLKGNQSRWLIFGEFRCFEKKKKPQKIQIHRERELCRLVLHVVFNLRPRTIDSDLRWKQEPAKKISGLHELKRSVWRILVLLFIDLLEWKQHRFRLAQLQDPLQFEPFVTTNRTLYCLANVPVAIWSPALLENISWAFFFTSGSSSETSPRLSRLCGHVLSGCFTKAGPCFQRSFRSTSSTFILGMLHQQGSMRF